jgi:hypothetical protein
MNCDIDKKSAFGIAVAATATAVLGIVLLFGSERIKLE